MITALLAPHARPVPGAPIPRRDQDSTPAGHTPATGTRTLHRALAGLGRWTVRLVLILAIAAFAALAVGPHLLDYRTMTMLTGSMAPAIDPGDVTVVTSLPVTDVQPGMIISYHIPVDDHRLVSHRILTATANPDGTVTVQTKGDANDAPDPWQAVLQGDTAWQVRAVVPELGNLIQALRTPLVSHALVYGAPTLLAGWLLLSIWRPTRTEDDQR
ncbi:signal peptidase, endoplasmic reticulum-type [Modestobacter sp. DSM 44400]|uniref:signal peptidase I n=1 Tax=Modestobacter sp. DSM 44400 TaxID=1550230 RepID=UPI0008946B11|nr:signal peptidase I [Modestobacter sp. DSM 44400]SDY52779.1 signal peptidase, endoplasmic reticulum-type [Modestobacter sp. DSM 44400]